MPTSFLKQGKTSSSTLPLTLTGAEIGRVPRVSIAVQWMRGRRSRRPHPLTRVRRHVVRVLSITEPVKIQGGVPDNPGDCSSRSSVIVIQYPSFSLPRVQRHHNAQRTSMVGMDDATGGAGTWARAAGASAGGARRLLGGLDLAAAENQVRKLKCKKMSPRSVEATRVPPVREGLRRRNKAGSSWCSSSPEHGRPPPPQL